MLGTGPEIHTTESGPVGIRSVEGHTGMQDLALKVNEPVLPPSELERLEQAMATWSSSEIIDWGVQRFGSDLVLTSSMADTVLLDLAVSVDPDIEVVFLDTGFHFAETLETLRRVQSRYGLNLRVERPHANEVDLFEVGTELCCAARKVIPLDRALAGKAAWLSGLRRADSASRADVPFVSVDRRGLVKLNPIASWSDEDVERYTMERELIVNPLRFEGYPSIGCWPCTSPVGRGEDSRAGRWAGTNKNECGIHQ